MHRLASTRSTLIVVMLVAGLAAAQHPAQALSPDVVISQVYGGGGATYTHDFIELFNRGSSPASLAGWSLQYASATGTGNFGANSAQLTELPNMILQPGQYLLVQQAAGATPANLPSPDIVDPTPINLSATGAKVALANTTASLGCNGGSTPCSPTQLAQIIDLIGWGNANFFEGAAAPATSITTAVLRNSNGCAETDNNAADFTAGAPAPRNTSSTLNPCGGGNAPITVTCGAPLSVLAGLGGSQAISASDTDGRVVNLAIGGVTPLPAGGGILLSGLVASPSPGGTATANVIVDPATPSGSYAVGIVATNDDATPQTATCTLNVTVEAVVPIGTVQGSVDDATSGVLHRSPFAPPSGNGTGQTVVVRGVIYQKTLARTSAGAANYGFFIQNTAATADADPNSSDGIFVFMSTFTSLIGGYTPEVGDEVILRGRVSEFFNLSQLSSASLVQLNRSGVGLDADVPPFEVNPPAQIDDANRYWERREGMRALVPAGSLAIDGRDVFPGTADAEQWLARGDSPIAQRPDPFARRAFRDPHPLDDDPALFDNDNGYRFILGSLGVKSAAGDTTVLLAPARTFDVVTSPLIGGVYFSFSKYQIQVEQQPVLAPGVDPSTNAPPQTFNRASEYSLATFNVENLYDYRDDPFDGCDFTGNSGCPGVNPPFDYVPASEAAYQARLTEIAQQIIGNLHGPDIIMVQEAEDQDICSAGAGALTCGAIDNADGRPDTLQELATRIAALGGPAYDAAYDRDGSDDRGIVSAFLYRTDRVELLPAAAADPVLGSTPQVIYRSAAVPYTADVQNPKALNAVLPLDVDTSTGVDGGNVFTRDPQVGLFRVWRLGIGSGTAIELYAISNHFSSTPNARVGQRKEQAGYNTAIVAALQAANPTVRVAVGGDLNVYPRPDDPFAPGHPLYPSDQLAALYNQGLTNLFDVVLGQVPVSAYGYVFQGQTQTLDQTFVTDPLLDDLVQARIAHINADWPADFDGDGPRGTSDHDPLVARFCRDVTAPVITASASPNSLWPPNHKLVPVAVNASATDDADETVAVQLVSVTSSEPGDGQGDGDTPSDIVIVDPFNFQLRAERAAQGTGRTYTIAYQATDACGNTGTATVAVTVAKSQGR
jgi:predicted extracellular nuclease